MIDSKLSWSPFASYEKQKILVPFCVESALSGVMQRVEPDTEMVRGYIIVIIVDILDVRNCR